MVTTFLPLFVYRDFFGHSKALCSPWSNLAEFRTHLRLYCCPCYLKNEEDPFKNEGARVFTILYVKFSDAQGQIPPETVVVSGLNLNSSKLSCMSSSPARMKMIQSKMKGLEWSQHFPIIKVERMQRSGTEAIRTQTQPSKPKREITKITNSQNTKRSYGQPSEQLFTE